MRRCYRLKFEVYGFASSDLECLPKAAFRIAILVCGISSDKSHRSTHYGLRNRDAKLGSGLFAQVP